MIQDELKKLLLESDEYRSSDGEVLVSKAINDSSSHNTKLLELLLKNEKMKLYFFEKVDTSDGEITIFKSEDFRRVLNDSRFLGNSFTRYANKIGLIDEHRGKMISNLDYVVLNYPFKDCSLDGSMTKEEGKRKNINETMINNIMFRDDIHKLLSPKAFTNAKKIEGIKKDVKIKSDDKLFDETTHTIEIKESSINEIKGTENMLINGNNLAALCSLKKVFEGKIKLIYIDPPYNTGNDTFSYNDNFNHSTWLVFMRDRLKIAHDLLSDDGVIFVQCDDNEQAYLKILMDEIFGRDNFISTSAVVINRGGRDYGGIAKTHEYILIYSKLALNELYFIENKDKIFDYQDNIGGFDLVELRNRNVLFNDKNRPNLCYPFYVNPNNKDNNNLFEISLENKKDFIKVMPLKSQGIQTVWRWGKEKALENLNLDLKAKKKYDGKYMIVQKYRKTVKRQRSVWEEKEYVNERGSEHLKKLFGEKLFMYPKAEYLLSRVIELSTKEGDIVMDFFAGSGTTLAVAHKMKRQYIGVEQIESHIDICVSRLKKVIEGEQGGISKALNWRGGGEFLYLEIAKYNEVWREAINKCKSSGELNQIYEAMKEKSLIEYRIDFDHFNHKVLDDSEFLSLELEDKKNIINAILDKNMFYVPFDEMEDSMFCLDKGSIKLSEEFYKKHLTYGTTGVSFTVASLQDAERGTQSDRVTE